MYSISQIRDGVQNPKLACRDLNKKYYSFKNSNPYNDDGIDIFDEDWDNLIILDACRYDLFESVSSIEGDLSKKASRGSHTLEFLKGNFKNRDLSDTVYVTASPMYYRHREELDAGIWAVDHVWMNDGWDNETQTVLPETVTSAALDRISDNPDKRLLVHFLQPHYPFVTSDYKFDKGTIEDEDTHSSFWRDILTGKLDVEVEMIWELYRENLELVLSEVRRLINNIHGKTVITSDHGNMLGERCNPIPIREFGHPPGVHTSELVEIPWLELPYEQRRKITKGNDGEGHIKTQESEQVKEKMKNLGYL